MPAAARAHTPAGAAAFAKFFMLTVDWGYATMNPSYLQHYASARCITCSSLVRGITAARREGHRYIGGRSTVAGVSTGRGGLFLSQVVFLNVTAFEEIDRSGAFVTGDPPAKRQPWAVMIKWSGSTWFVAALAVRV